jgi:hypothetical protein
LIAATRSSDLIAAEPKKNRAIESATPGDKFSIRLSNDDFAFLLDLADALPRLPALPVGGLLVVAMPLHIADEPFALT